MGTSLDRRKFQRTAYASSMDYSLFVLDYKNMKKVEADATVVDMCREGLGFYTDYPLEPGHILRLRPDSGAEQTAMVRWVETSGARYRVGVLLY